MAILVTGNTFATNDQVTATKLNNVANAATFASGAVDDSTTQLSGGAIIVKDAGVTLAKLATSAYEAGSWTPSIGGTATYTTQLGRYTKIGRIVHIEGRLVINSIGVGASTSAIAGLPYAAAAATGGVVSFWASAANVPVFASCYTNSSSLILSGLTAGSANITTNFPMLGSSTDIIFSISYSV
jgi:hypothetical protein